MKDIIHEIKKFQYFYPYTVAVVGAQIGDRANYMSCAWHTALSFEPPLFGILVAKKRLTHRFISDAGEFTVNFLARKDVGLSARMGRVSGHDRDKIKEFNISLTPSRFIRTPTFSAAYAAFECRLQDIRTYGDHDLFVGEVLAVHADRGSFDDDGVLDPHKVKPLLYLGSDFYLSVDASSLEQKKGPEEEP
jgi:flavin reductase (DIM6/NTAB) family NADH-FMN oxidoreductase RutF